MKILVTGATGFIGSKLIKFLVSRKHIIYGISRTTTNSKNISSVSLLNENGLNSFFKTKKFDVVIHLAGLLFNNSPLEAFQNNCQGTINLLECCRVNKIKKVVFVSTHAVYGHTKYLPIDEEHPVTPTTNYALTKLIAENICKMYSFSHGISMSILRITSVYGPNQPEKYLIPRMINDCIQNKKMTLHAYLNGYQTMDLIHVNDVCKAIELACEDKTKLGIYNIASGMPITTKDISEKLSSIMKIKNISVEKIPQETNHFFYDVSSANSILGFKAKEKLSEKSLHEIVKNTRK
jgi:nucleoside-diphosphate-sugar epimerase